MSNALEMVSLVSELSLVVKKDSVEEIPAEGRSFSKSRGVCPAGSMKSVALGSEAVQEIPVRCILSGLVRMSFMAKSQGL